MADVMTAKQTKTMTHMLLSKGIINCRKSFFSTKFFFIIILVEEYINGTVKSTTRSLASVMDSAVTAMSAF